MYNNPKLCSKMKENELNYFQEKMTVEYAYKLISDHIKSSI
jgi:hypothetical protein